MEGDDAPTTAAARSASARRGTTRPSLRRASSVGAPPGDGEFVVHRVDLELILDRRHLSDWLHSAQFGLAAAQADHCSAHLAATHSRAGWRFTSKSS